MQNTARDTQVHQLLQELTHSQPHMRRSAVGHLVRLILSADEVSPEMQSTVIASLLSCLQDSDYSVCTASIRALRAIGVESDDAAQRQQRIDMLLGHLTSAFPNVRRFAINALADVLQPNAGAAHAAASMVATALLRCLEDEDHSVRTAAIRALRSLDAEVRDAKTARDRIPILLQTFTSPHAYVRRYGIGALTELCSDFAEAWHEFQPKMVAALHARLEDTDQGVRTAAANALKVLSP